MYLLRAMHPKWSSFYISEKSISNIQKALRVSSHAEPEILMISPGFIFDRKVQMNCRLFSQHENYTTKHHIVKLIYDVNIYIFISKTFKK